MTPPSPRDSVQVPWAHVAAGHKDLTAQEEEEVAWTCSSCDLPHFNNYMKTCRKCGTHRRARIVSFQDDDSENDPPPGQHLKRRPTRPKSNTSPYMSEDDTRWGWTSCWCCGKSGHVATNCWHRQHRPNDKRKGAWNKRKDTRLEDGVKERPIGSPSTKTGPIRRSDLEERKNTLTKLIEDPEALAAAIASIDKQITAIKHQEDMHRADHPVPNFGYLQRKLDKSMKAAAKAATHLDEANSNLLKAHEAHILAQEHCAAKQEQVRLATSAMHTAANHVTVGGQNIEVGGKTISPEDHVKLVTGIARVAQLTERLKSPEIISHADSRYTTYVEKLKNDEPGSHPLPPPEWVIQEIAGELVEVLGEWQPVITEAGGSSQQGPDPPPGLGARVPQINLQPATLQLSQNSARGSAGSPGSANTSANTTPRDPRHKEALTKKTPEEMAAALKAAQGAAKTISKDKERRTSVRRKRLGKQEADALMEEVEESEEEDDQLPQLTPEEVAAAPAAPSA